MVLYMECRGGDYPAKFLRPMADRAGVVLVSCAIRGNSTSTQANPLGTVWNNGNPRVRGHEDMDYAAAVIGRVRESDPCSDAFMGGLSKGGHMAYAFACERPALLKAVCSVDEFMGLTTNIPSAPLPVLAVHGTLDTNVPYAMAKDSVDAWRRLAGLLSGTPETTHESSPLMRWSVPTTVRASAPS
jgi:poly(3-hydroxybutyrate) depolymerase